MGLILLALRFGFGPGWDRWFSEDAFFQWLLGIAGADLLRSCCRRRFVVWLPLRLQHSAGRVAERGCNWGKWLRLWELGRCDHGYGETGIFRAD
jgi:hypothetical protein